MSDLKPGQIKSAPPAPASRRFAGFTDLLSENPFLRLLQVGGASLVLLGGVIAISAKLNADDLARSRELYYILGGGFRSAAPIDAAFGVMWFGVVLAVAGAVLLTIWVSIRATQPVTAPRP